MYRRYYRINRTDPYDGAYDWRFRDYVMMSLTLLGLMAIVVFINYCVSNNGATTIREQPSTGVGADSLRKKPAQDYGAEKTTFVGKIKAEASVSKNLKTAFLIWVQTQ